MGHDDNPDCTERCKSTQHGDIITAAISRRSVSDSDLCSYLNFTCFRCESVRDAVGRTALHVAASCGRIDLVRWLIEKRHANIDAKDEESKFTALHRSIFYGKINVAVELIRLGANTSLLDADSLTMLEHAMKDGFAPNLNESGELYVWGSNSNNCFGPHQSRAVPELLDVFHKNYPDEYVDNVYIGKFHSVILTSFGKVFCAGHGQGGRLGLGREQTVVEPELVHFPQNNQNEAVCLEAAISVDHSVYLLSDGNVYTCGINTHHVLGLRNIPDKELLPTPLKRLSEELKGVAAGQYHSLAWDSNTVFVWGLNGGQLGPIDHRNRKYISTPKAITGLNIGESKIELVASSTGAVSVYTDKGDIYVLHEYRCRKIASRQLNMVQISVFGGKLYSKSKDLAGEANRELKVVALTNTGNLFLWQESDPQLCRCIFSLSRAIIVKQVVINIEALLFVTLDGEAFQGFIKPRKKKNSVNSEPNNEKSAFHKYLDREDCISVKIAKFPRIHRAILINSDSKSRDFCVIQEPPYKKFSGPQIVASEFKDNFKLLLEDCHENDDMHDVVFKVGKRHFAAHKYIVASKSEYLKKRFLDVNEELVVLANFNALIFEQFLLFVYTNDCALLKCGVCPDALKSLCTKHKEVSDDINSNEQIDKSLSAFQVYSNHNLEQEKSSGKIKDPVRMLHEMAKKLGCVALCNILSNFEMHKFMITRKNGEGAVIRFSPFKRLQMKEFSDVTIKCADDNLVKAHKCVLAARTEYFHSLFSSRWRGTESSTITLPCSRNIVEALLHYLYTDTLLDINNKEQDTLFKLIILADQFFILRLKEQCEYLLYTCLTLKNAVQFLNLANTYNADKLKRSCLQFIISNIAPFLEQRLFEGLDEILLKEVNEFYFNFNSRVRCREITPYSTAPVEEEILSVSTSFPVSLNDEAKFAPIKSSQKKRQRSHRNSALTETSGQNSSVLENISDESLIQFPDSPSDLMGTVTNVSDRLKAIKLAEGQIEHHNFKTDFVKLMSKNRNSDTVASSFEDFPLLSSSQTSTNSFAAKSPNKPESSRHFKAAKVSQKQRKRLSSENNSVELSPKNPWKILDFGSPVSPETSMNAIIYSEKKQKENLVKITSKSLMHTQIEDKAIEDLCKFYNVCDITDELICVQRVDIGCVAAPMWVSGVKKLDS